MTKKEFKKLFQNRLILLDGGMGTLLQKAGMPNGVCPEKWAVSNSDLLKETQRKYVEAGSDIIYAFTFGANPIKLSEYGIADETCALNKALAQIARDAADKEALVAGDISSCGSLLYPFGSVMFDEAVEGFKKQVKGLLDGDRKSVV